MSDEKTKPNANTDADKKEPADTSVDKKAAGDDKPQSDDGGEVSKMRERIKALEKRASDAEKKADGLEQEKLKKNGDIEGLLKREREKNAKLTAQVKEAKVHTLKQSLSTQILKHAPDAHNVDLITKLPEMKETVEMNHETLELSGVEEGLKKVRKSHPYLFKVGNSPMGNTRLPNPNSGNVGDDAEARDFQTKMLAAKSLQERTVIRRNFGREL